MPLPKVFLGRMGDARSTWSEDFRPVAGGSCTRLIGRRREREALGALVDTVRAGESRALVVSGEPGVGKTALLDWLVDETSGVRIVRATGVQAEMDLPFAALHQLLAPVLDRLDRLPAPQRDALRTCFGISPGRLRTASSEAWPSWACLPTSPRNSR